ncbi:hypothetical protein AA106555_0710 [Neokomagataea thailandica NBRC 106555]|uniref:Helix-turn-helix domain-containing protein n=1 Tax=Neokomagataea thailandica NBRC 106555 TaxID=1223520 RepID=A0ABQ0QNX3_9PROT|nr:helix-turn-helix domain-containing protein [Neokomagataea thailandica]GBR51858.1 hypothetical protein AA106555_0710 [Neokomagataea thailandica NBRC 106555]
MTSFAAQLRILTQAKALSGNDLVVLEALSSFSGHRGLFPSHERIASRSGRSVRSVIRSLEKAYRLGIVERTRQRVRRGNRLVCGPNTYRLIVVSLEQAKAAAKHNAQRLMEALKRRKERFLSKCQNDSEFNSQSLFFKEKHHSPAKWIDILERLNGGATPEEAGYT